MTSSQSLLSPPIFYLESDNFDDQFRLIPNIRHPAYPKLMFTGNVIVMIQGNYCGYCTQLKPIFQKIAEKHDTFENPSGLSFATIQIDETPTEKTISFEMLKNILQFEIPGVPIIVKFFQGRPTDVYRGKHDFHELEQWVLS